MGRHSMGASSAIKELGNIDKIQAKSVLQQVVQSGPVFEAAVAQACQAQGGEGIARQRNGMLYSTGGFAAAAGGVIAAGTSTTLFNVPIGNADPVLGAITAAETNLTSQSRLTNEAFVTWGLGFKIFPFSDIAAENDQDAYDMITSLYKNCSVKLQLGAQDVQRLGTLDMWPAAGYTPNTSGVAAGPLYPLASSAGFLANGSDVVQDYQLEIPNDTTLNITITCERAIAVAGIAGASSFAVQARFYGWSQTAIMG
jgi:hypothetical protein